jgi:hypothetical protein
MLKQEKTAPDDEEPIVRKEETFSLACLLLP